ncbi:MAG TPA: UbiA family prenyltransferase [Chitinophagaceae bacterium]|nr:UbiA family prenyltransferase [Chitinophagaceae bacterium]
MLHLPFNNISFYLFVSGATIVQYNLHYLMKTTAVQDSQRLTWSLKNKDLHITLCIIGCVMIIISLFSFQVHHFYILSILGAIAFLYSYPALPFGKRRRIKDYGLLKIITLALLWTLVTVWFPVSEMPIEKGIYVLVFAKRFTFIFVLCLLFDIRDIDVDRHENRITLPVILGKKKSYFTAWIVLFLFLILSCLQNYFYPELGVFIAMLLSTLATFFIVQLSKKINSDFVYLAGIDGMMLLQAVLVYLLTLKL